MKKLIFTIFYRYFEFSRSSVRKLKINKKIVNINFFTLGFFIFHFATLSFDWHMNCDFLTKPEVADFIEAKMKLTFKDDLHS